MEPSQGPVERKAHGARMPTDPPHPDPVLYHREERKKNRKQERETARKNILHVANQKQMIT